MTLLNTVIKCNVKSIKGGLCHHFGASSPVSEIISYQ